MIICAALKIEMPNQKQPIVISGLRHGDCYYQAKLANIATNSENTVEGFVDNIGKFYDRHEALEYVHNISQISFTSYEYKIENCETELYTEDLY